MPIIQLVTVSFLTPSARYTSRLTSFGRSKATPPSVTVTGKAKVTSQKITVTLNGRTVVKNKASAKLKAGTYKIKTTAKYKTYTVKHKPSTTKQTVTVRKGDTVDVMCRTDSVSPTVVYGQLISITAHGLRCTSSKLAAPITAEVAVFTNGSFSSRLGIVAYYLADREFGAKYTAPADIVSTVKSGGEPYLQYAAKAKTITKTQTLKVKTK